MQSFGSKVLGNVPSLWIFQMIRNVSFYLFAFSEMNCKVQWFYIGISQELQFWINFDTKKNVILQYDFEKVTFEIDAFLITYPYGKY